MNFDSLSYVKFGDKDGLGEFLFENEVQHRLFFETLADKGLLVPQYPIGDADPSNLDDWNFNHNEEHEKLASVLSLDNPIQLLDVNFNIEDDFYDWLGVHQTIHQQIAEALGLT